VLADAVRVRELTTVLRALEESGAVPVVFKGAALAHTHYAASWQRPRSDADVLIAPASRERVVAVLHDLGYRQPAFISGELVMYQAPFVRIDHLGLEHVLDIHWRIANPQAVSQVLTHEELAARSDIAGVDGYAMRVPSPVDALLLACVHRAAHHSDCEWPVWIDDIHRLASRFEPSDWQTFVDRATARSVRAICLQGLTRAAELFQTAVPGGVVDALSAAPREASAIYLRGDLRPIDRLRADLRALGPLGAARLLREHLLPPPAYMRQKYRLRSRAWLPAYYAMRVLSGMSKWIRAA
jgi:hypothetical protein